MYASTTSSPTPPLARRTTSVAAGERLADAAGWAVELGVLSETVCSCVPAANSGTAAATSNAMYFIFFIKSPYFGFVFPLSLDTCPDGLIHHPKPGVPWRYLEFNPAFFDCKLPG